MASAFSHIAIPICVAVGMKAPKIPTKLLFLGMLLSILPDLDVIAFKFGIAYSSQWGHRGFTHSFVFCVIFAAFLMPLSSYFKTSKRVVFAFSFISLFSHTVLDMFTNGGLGVALLWPFEHMRIFAPIAPIEVSPIGIRNFFTARGLEVIKSELFYIWLPCLTLGLSARLLSKIIIEKRQSNT